MPTKAQTKRPFYPKPAQAQFGRGPTLPGCLPEPLPGISHLYGSLHAKSPRTTRKTLSLSRKTYSCRDPSAKPPRWLTLLVAVLLPAARVARASKSDSKRKSHPNPARISPKRVQTPTPAPSPRIRFESDDATRPPIWAVAAPPRPPSPASLPWRFTSRAPSLGKLPHSLSRHPDSNARAL